MLNIVLIALFGAIWRLIDGRSFRPNYWNVVLYVGLPYICFYVFGYTFSSVAICLLTALNLTLGYKSFTLPWVCHNILLFRLWFKNYMKKYREPDLSQWVVWANYEASKEEYKFIYENSNGFHTWHTTYRFLIPSLVICSLTGWNLYYLGAVTISGALFPLTVKYWNTEAAAWIREFILGVTVIGGLAWI